MYSFTAQPTDQLLEGWTSGSTLVGLLVDRWSLRVVLVEDLMKMAAPLFSHDQERSHADLARSR